MNSEVKIRKIKISVIFYVYRTKKLKKLLR